MGMQPGLAVLLPARIVGAFRAGIGDIERDGVLVVVVILMVMGVVMPGRMIVDVGADLARGNPDQERDRAQHRHEAPENASPKPPAVIRSLCHALRFFHPIRGH